jgi:hypothetical protein
MPRAWRTGTNTTLWWIPTGRNVNPSAPTLNEIWGKGVDITGVIEDETFKEPPYVETVKTPFIIFKEDKVHGLEAQARTARENTSINHSVDLENKLTAFIDNKIKSEAHQQLLNEVAAQMSVMRKILQESQTDRINLRRNIDGLNRDVENARNDRASIEAELEDKIKRLKKRVYKLAKLLAARA